MNVPSGGTLTLANAANAYSGGTSVNGGQLNVSSDGNFGTVPTSPATNLTLTGGTLQATGGFTLNANRNVAIASNPTFDVVAGQSLTVAGIVAGNGGLTKTDGGTLVLLGSNTYQGGTTEHQRRDRFRLRQCGLGERFLAGHHQQRRLDVQNGAPLSTGRLG